jgi:hypothetical protein
MENIVFGIREPKYIFLKTILTGKIEEKRGPDNILDNVVAPQHQELM